MTDWVRARTPVGHEVTVSARAAKSRALAVLDKPAVDTNGRPLPMKPKTNLAPPPGGAVVSAPERTNQEAPK